MQKKLFLIGACLFFATQFAFGSTPSSLIEKPVYDIDYGIKVSYQELTSMTPKEYKKLTGHKLGLFKSIALKMMQKKIRKADESNNKNQVTALLLCIFLGGLGIHRFYLGYTWQGIVQLLTAGGLGIWWLIDLIRIITGDLKPKNGEYAKKL